jgi:hypothetical protein
MVDLDRWVEGFRQRREAGPGCPHYRFRNPQVYLPRCAGQMKKNATPARTLADTGLAALSRTPRSDPHVPCVHRDIFVKSATSRLSIAGLTITID